MPRLSLAYYSPRLSAVAVTQIDLVPELDYSPRLSALAVTQIDLVPELDYSPRL